MQQPGMHKYISQCCCHRTGFPSAYDTVQINNRLLLLAVLCEKSQKTDGIALVIWRMPVGREYAYWGIGM